MVKVALTHRTKDIQPQYNQCKMNENKGNMKSNKGTRKWCEFQKNPWHNTNECCLKKLLMAELKKK
jgi:hypothetical protein